MPRLLIAMAITEMIMPGLRSGNSHARRANSSLETAGCTASWRVWGTNAHVSVTDPSALPAARRLVARTFATAEKAAARFRRDAELHKLYRAGGREITVSPALADLIAAALLAAERTDGDVDPTVGAAMTAVHSGRRPGRRDRSGVPICGSRPTSRPVPGWQQVDLHGRRLQVPIGTTLDLSATATAVACDRAAAMVRDRLGVGVLVGLGGDAASAGPAPDGGWRVEIEDRTGTSRTAVLLPAGAAIATSHFAARTHGVDDGIGPAEADGAERVARLPGHLIDPRTGREPAPVWRMASAIGFTSLEASTYTAAALVRGTSARAWLSQLWVPSRLITTQGDVITVGTWDAHLAGNEAAANAPAHKDTSRSLFPALLANPQRTNL
jgi:thiamine biosynthesis lipoprotein